MIKGVIFDMDGVLFDTEKLYEKFWCLAASELGFSMGVDDVAAIRSTDAKLAKEILKQRIDKEFPYEEVKALRIQRMHEYTEEFGVECMPGVVDFLEFLKKKQYKIAIATTSNQERTRGFLEKTKLVRFFDYIMTGDLVTNCKPDPEIYQKAATGLGLSPKQCYAIEDSYNGVRSAYNAGCKVIMVPDRDEPIEEMHEKTIYIARSLNDLLNKKELFP